MNQQPDEEIHRARSGAGAESSVPNKLGCHPSGSCMCSPIWKLSEPQIWGIFMESLSLWIDH